MAFREAQRWMEPAPERKILEWLSALYLKTASPQMGDDDFRAKMKIYARELTAYPADVVRDVVRNYGGKFFPAYVELKELIIRDDRVRRRIKTIGALRKFLTEGEEEEFSISSEERARVVKGFEQLQSILKRTAPPAP